MKRLVPRQDLLLRLLSRHAERGEEWCTARELGGTGWSYHTEQLTHMHRFGVVDRQNIGEGKTRPYWRYRISEAGRRYLEEHPVAARP